MGKNIIVELKHINKRFAKVLANDDVSMVIKEGEVVALLGENGAGKSTIMKILYGLYHATEGEIFIHQKKAEIRSPKEAMACGIAMIQQHFSLVEAHTVTENIILGHCKGKIDFTEKEKEIQALADQYHFDVPAGELVKNLTVGAQQKVEILKALYLNAKIIIMDEPTAVLTPQEADVLMGFVRDYVAKGNSIVFITHKMKEVLEVSDRIIVLRNGKISGTIEEGEIRTVKESELVNLMIGHDLEIIKAPTRTGTDNRKNRLEVEHVSLKSKDNIPLLDNVSFSIKEGEILGFAGVSGNGQQELCEAIYGARKLHAGKVILDGEEISQLAVRERIEKGIGYLASDRYRYGMISGMTLSENILLKASYLKNWVKNGIIKWKELNNYTENIIQEYRVKAPDHEVVIGSLSGGNQQKVVVAREVDRGEKLIIFDQPTRGLDLGAINYVHKTIMREKSKGKSILLVSTELSEIFALSDRIAILYKGKIMGIFQNGELSTEQIGLLMAGYELKEA